MSRTEQSPIYIVLYMQAPIEAIEREYKLVVVIAMEVYTELLHWNGWRFCLVFPLICPKYSFHTYTLTKCLKLYICIYYVETAQKTAKAPCIFYKSVCKTYLYLVFVCFQLGTNFHISRIKALGGFSFLIYFQIV